jgi:hypothetical protein
MTGETFKDSVPLTIRKSPPPNSQEDSMPPISRPWHGLQLAEGEREVLAEEVAEAIEAHIHGVFLDSYGAIDIARMAIEYLETGEISDGT